MSLKKYSIQVFVFLGFLSSVSFGFDASRLDLRSLGDQYVLDNQDLSGDWKGAQTWAGTFCNGHYAYDVHYQGRTDNVVLKLNDQGSLDVTGRLLNIYTNLDGEYASEYSLCAPLKGALGVGADSADIKANVVFIEHPGQDTELKVKVSQTKLGTIRLAQWVPEWFENFLTGLVNEGLEEVWSSSLGSWLNDKLSDILQHQLHPHPKPAAR